MKRLFLFAFLLIQTLLFCQEKWDFQLYNEVVNREVYIYANNEENLPISAHFQFKLKNLTCTLPNNEIIVIPPKTRKFLIAKLAPIKTTESNSFSYSNSYNFGNALQETFDDDYIYSLPFEKGRTQLIYQGYNGKFSHQNEFALDFNLKMGAPILAAREGIAVLVISNNTSTCPDISCAKYNNKIVIMHSDGTFADYSHLRFQGAAVKKGDYIRTNQLIGYSGNTGFSSGPHLHFSVFINRITGKRTFIKTKFKTSESNATLLEEGKNYTKNY